MTYNGLKRAIENETLPTKKVKELCKILEITPNDFFGTSSVNGNGNIVGNIVGDNSKVIGGMVGRCPLCAEKDKEISVLKDKIISLQEKLIEKYQPKTRQYQPKTRQYQPKTRQYQPKTH